MPSDRILVVDDEEPIREIVSSMLGPANYQCRQAASGLEALALLDSGEEFELMLSDLMMADLDGIGLLERTKERYPDMPVVMVTAVHDISVALAAIRNGAYDYLLKPFEREPLLNTVRRALENRRLKLENRAYQTNLEALVAQRTEQLRDAMKDLERSYDITLEALGDALDLKDAETEGHSKRVTAYTIAIARADGRSARTDGHHRAWRLPARHRQDGDSRRYSLEARSPDARSKSPIMREHCYRGYQMLKKIPFLQEAAEIVYAHQERFDGTGYPRGLKGEAIPLGARIFSIGDTLDAIRSDRPYRAARPLSAAKEEIKTWSGRQFDPSIVEVFLSMPDTLWEDLRTQINAQTSRYPARADGKGAP